MSNLSDDQIEAIIDLCSGMLEKSYCVYSRFPVAAVIICEDDQKFTGCNVENASYGLSFCAERTAAVKAVSEGCRKFKACFVMTKSQNKISPCGACRQFLAEFGIDQTLYLIASDRKYVKLKLKDLLPNAFTPSELESGTDKNN